MRKPTLLTLLFLLLPVSALAESDPAELLNRQASPLPGARANGDYSRPYHDFWLVTAKNGLNGRFKANPDKATEPDFKDPNYGEWPVVNFFPKGTILRATTKGSQMGAATWEDKAGRTWLRVQASGLDGRDCFVRSNDKFIRPVRVTIE